MLLRNRLLRIVSIVALAIAGCARVAVEGGDKPIKIDMTITLKVDQQLDQFYSFEDKYNHAATQPATQPASNMGGGQ